MKEKKEGDRFSAPVPRLLGLEWPPLSLGLEVEGEDRLVREDRGKSEREQEKRRRGCSRETAGRRLLSVRFSSFPFFDK
jgi:hypothetical protein